MWLFASLLLVAAGWPAIAEARVVIIYRAIGVGPVKGRLQDVRLRVRCPGVVLLPWEACAEALQLLGSRDAGDVRIKSADEMAALLDPVMAAKGAPDTMLIIAERAAPTSQDSGVMPGERAKGVHRWVRVQRFDYAQGEGTYARVLPLSESRRGALLAGQSHWPILHLDVPEEVRSTELFFVSYEVNPANGAVTARKLGGGSGVISDYQGTARKYVLAEGVALWTFPVSNDMGQEGQLVYSPVYGLVGLFLQAKHVEGKGGSPLDRPMVNGLVGLHDTATSVSSDEMFALLFAQQSPPGPDSSGGGVASSWVLWTATAAFIIGLAIAGVVYCMKSRRRAR